MLRIYFLQQWFNLSDPAVEEAFYDSLALRGFVGIDLGREPVPDETTVCRFRHLLEEHDLAAAPTLYPSGAAEICAGYHAGSLRPPNR
jgi:IS5 family transposase